MAEYNLWFGLIRSKGKGSKDDISQDKSGRDIYGQLVLCYLGDKSENLRRMNHLKKFNKANRKFCWQKMLDFSRIICLLALKIVDNLI